MNSKIFTCAVAFLASHLALPLSHSYSADLRETLKPFIESHAGDVAVAVKNLKTGETYEFKSNEVMPTASLIKFPILIELYRQLDEGRIPKDRLLKLTKEEMVPGSGVLTEHFPVETQIPIEGVARLMITYSDNTATNMILDQIGIQPVIDTMKKMGYGETRVHSKSYRRDLSVDPERSVKYGLGSTTAADMISLLEKLYKKEIVSAQASETMLKHLATCDDRSKLLRFLPKSMKSFHKTGAVANVRTDAGLFETPMGTLAIAVLTNNNKDQTWGEENAAEILCGKIGLAAVEYFNPKGIAPVESANDGTLRIGATGELVEALQRALNKNRGEASALSVDGDFGPGTEAMVKKFQAKNKIPETGIVDAATWSALGPLQLDKDDVPSPDVVNKIVIDRLPADPLTGVPFVSSKAWAIADGESGKILASSKGDEKLDIASTTKIMTAWLVIRESQKDPNVLDEVVTFSKRADDTTGSSATVRAGEKVPVRELLFGLMLPSGNDASVAFGEHFGSRLAKAEGIAETADSLAADSLADFIAAMNREAKRLGLMNTHYVNTSGLTAEGHKSSCEDLIRLAREAMKDELFRKVVSTRQRGAQLTGSSGYTRNIVWSNTNPLLKSEGYLGIKTGTTDAAGACLVSCSERDGKRLYVVILGASGSPAREADSRNLHRYGWSLMK